MLNHKVKIKLCHLGPLVAQMTINHSKHEGGKKKTTQTKHQNANFTQQFGY